MEGQDRSGCKVHKSMSVVIGAELLWPPNVLSPENIYWTSFLQSLIDAILREVTSFLLSAFTSSVNAA